MAGSIATPIGLLVLLLVFDWRLGLLCLIPVALGFACMMLMTGSGMRAKMTEYQNALADMSNQAVEYVAAGCQNLWANRGKCAIGNYKPASTIPVLEAPPPCSAFAFLVAAAFLFTAEGVTDQFLLNLLFYIIITPVISTTLTKIMTENTDGHGRCPRAHFNLAPCPRQPIPKCPQTAVEWTTVAFDGRHPSGGGKSGTLANPDLPVL